MNWLAVAFLAGLLSNSLHFVSRYLLKNGDDSTAVAWIQSFFRVIFFGIWALVSFNLKTDLKSLSLLLGLGFVEVFSTYAYMKMHSHAQLSLSSIISRTRLFWIPVMAFLFFRERLQLHEYAGIAVLFVGLAIVSSPKKLAADKGLRYAYIFGLVSALVNILLKANEGNASIPVIMVFMSTPPVLFLPFLMKKGFTRIAATFKLNLGLKLLSGLLSVISIYTLTYAIRIGPVSKVSAIQQGMLIVSVFAGIIFLKERDNMWKKIIGSIITLGGVYLITMAG